MLTKDLENFVEQLRSLVRNQDSGVITESLEGILPEDLAEGVSRLQSDEAITILSALDPELAGYVLVELPTETAREIMNELPDYALAHYLDVLPMDDALELREELGPERFEDLLEIIPKEDAQELRRLLAYPEGTVGRLMTERFFEVSPETTVSQLLEDIRNASDEKYETVNDIYVLSPDRHLLGVFSLRKAIRSPLSTPASELMREEVVTCNASDTAEASARSMARYGFYALPVLDGRGRIVGIFTGDDAQTVLREEETRDIESLGAVSGDAEPYLSIGVLKMAWKRLPWLFALFIAETATGSVMRRYGGDGAIAGYLFFLPLILGAGGNSGSQATTMITRGLAVGNVRTKDWLLIARKEFLTALIVGTSLGLAGMLRSIFWGAEPALMYSIGCALPAIVLWATAVGGLLPLGAKRLGIDPAVMSAPFISTFVDATGLIIYFEIVKAFFGGKLPI